MLQNWQNISIFTQSWKKSFTKILSLLSKMQFDWRCECYVVDKNICERI